MHNNYYYQALEDLQFLERNLDGNDYTHIAAYCYKVMDKMLRTLLEIYGVSKGEVIRTTRLVTLYRKLCKVKVKLPITSNHLVELSTIYDNYIRVDVSYRSVNKDKLFDYINDMYMLIQSVNYHRRRFGYGVVSVTPKELGFASSESIDAIFCQYRNKFHILNNAEWGMELGRLFEVFGTTDMARLSVNIKELYL